MRIGDARERVQHGVDIGRHSQAHGLVIVAGIDDDCHPAAAQTAQSICQLGAADLTCQCNN